LKNKNFPDYFGSYNNSALIKKEKKVVHFNSFPAVEFDDLRTLKGCPLGDSPEGTRLSFDLIIA